ncbi:MAG: cytochrome c [Acidobacteriia bacterium]|nr:cytochrome c [Terriglobia bacterium]
MRRASIAAVSLLAALALAEGVALGWIAVRSRWRAEASAAAVPRGRAVAERMGCFACHGDGGARPIPNLGSKSGEVPGWTGGTWMMWNRSEDDVKGWILDGHPPGRAPDSGALIAMPPYRGRLTGEETDALVAFVLAVSLFGSPIEPAAAEGRDVALRLGCFGCHGPEGRGVVSNPGSLKGYVPGWEGGDYRELVASDDEFRQWVMNGISDRMAANPVARRILATQTVRMPAFRGRATPVDVESLQAFVRWVREHPRGVSAGKP